jgi:pimeloyl-ACP methyl ester carboxylesterase
MAGLSALPESGNEHRPFADGLLKTIIGAAVVSSSQTLADRGGLTWSQCQISLLVGGEILNFNMFSVRRTDILASRSIIVFPGRNADPAEVTGLNAPDFPDRAVAHALAKACYDAHVIDYVPGGPSGNALSRTERNTQLIEADHRLKERGASLGSSIACAAAAFMREREIARKPVTGLFGHSAGAFLASVCAAVTGQRVSLALASGVIPAHVLFGPARAASELHNLGRAACYPDGFGAIIAQSAVTAVQVQYGAHDSVFLQQWLIAGAAEVAAAVTVPVDTWAMALTTRP